MVIFMFLGGFTNLFPPCHREVQTSPYQILRQSTVCLPSKNLCLFLELELYLQVTQACQTVTLSA